MSKEIERRFIPRANAEVRATKGTDGKRGIIGTGAVFNTLSEVLYGFREKIALGAFDKALTVSDVRGLFNHDPNFVLGRVKPGTMRVWVDGAGFQYEIPEMPASRSDVVEAIDRGDVDGNSFSFTVEKDEWDYETTPPTRTITQFGELFDVGPVTYPAYPATSVSARALEMVGKHAEEPKDPAPEAVPEAPDFSLEHQKIVLALADEPESH